MSTIPEPYRRLVDDAAIFPPGDAPLPRAIAEHRTHRGSAHGDLLGCFVVDDRRLPELVEALRQSPDPDGAPLAVSVLVTGGAGAIEPAVRWTQQSTDVTLAGIELMLRDEADLAHNARRMLTAVDQLVGAGVLAEQVPVYVEPPRPHGAEPSPTWFGALDELAAADLRLKFRTGGLDADAFPSAVELAAGIAAALDRELAFKCTAGLHHALRHRDPGTGFEHHGFLNVLLATRASLDGADAGEVASALDQRDPAAVLDRLATLGEDTLTRTRRWFTGFGSCSVTDPLTDLTKLALLPDPPTE